jgi:malonyl-CoA/methylmalonyl-CoA synthetase
MPVYHKVLNYFKNVAITDADGDFIYEDVFRRSCRLAKEIQSLLKHEKFDQKICLVCPNGVSFVVAQWATWMSGNIVVPLSSSHSTDALEYFAKDCKASLVIGTRDTEEKLNELTKQIDIPLCILDKTYTANPVTEFDDTLNVESFDQLFYAERHTALLLYTAISTGPPRGLLYRHYNLNAQADGIVQVIVLLVLLRKYKK